MEYDMIVEDSPLTKETVSALINRRHNFLVVYSDIPSRTRVVLVQTTDAEFAQEVRDCHGKIGAAVNFSYAVVARILQEAKVLYDSNRVENPIIRIEELPTNCELIHTGWREEEQYVSWFDS